MATHSSILAGKPGGYSLWGLRELDKMTEQLNTFTLGFPGGSDSKASARNAGDLSSIPGSGRSPGEENGNPLQCHKDQRTLGKRGMKGESAIWKNNVFPSLTII